MRLTPLQLEGYYVRDLRFSLKPRVEEKMKAKALPNLQHIVTHDLPAEPLTIDILFNGDPKEDDFSRWRFEITVQSKNLDESDYPYDFSVAIVGFFKSSFNDPIGKDQKLIRTNAISVLYSIARDVVSSTTSRGPYPGALLPLVSFFESPIVESKDYKGSAGGKRQAITRAENQKLKRVKSAKKSSSKKSSRLLK